ncbi:MAG: hypothetical protein ACRC1F_00275 [Metamycoplasmataceae bacterium]
MKLKYVPGMRPTPMLMYQNTPNFDSFNEDENRYKKGNYTPKENHMWNMGSYLIYNENLEIISYRIANPYNFLWLLRVINKEITVEFDDIFIKENEKFLIETSEELISM